MNAFEADHISDALKDMRGEPVPGCPPVGFHQADRPVQSEQVRDRPEAISGQVSGLRIMEEKGAMVPACLPKSRIWLGGFDLKNSTGLAPGMGGLRGMIRMEGLGLPKG